MNPERTPKIKSVWPYWLKSPAEKIVASKHFQAS